MNFKRFFGAMLALVLVLALVSCGSAAKTNDDETESSLETKETTPNGVSPRDEVDIDYEMDYMNEDLSAYITLGEYKGLSAEISTYKITEEYINEQIEALLESSTETVQVTDRLTAEGDVICVDYSGTLDGVAFDGGTATNQEITLTENSGYIPGFAEGMYGVMPGSTVSYEVTFPDEYSPNPDLAGKLTVFTVTVHYIEEEVVPELNDEFVSKNFGEAGCNTVEEFMTYYKGFLEEQRIETFEEEAALAIWEQIMENTVKISIPQKAVDSLYWSTRTDYESYASMYGMTYEDFLAQAVGMTDETMIKYSEEYIFEDLVVYSLIKAEGLEVTDEEYASGVKVLAVEYEMDEEEFLETFEENDIKNVLRWRKLLDAIYSWSNITEKVAQ